MNFEKVIKLESNYLCEIISTQIWPLIREEDSSRPRVSAFKWFGKDLILYREWAQVILYLGRPSKWKAHSKCTVGSSSEQQHKYRLCRNTISFKKQWWIALLAKRQQGEQRWISLFQSNATNFFLLCLPTFGHIQLFSFWNISKKVTACAQSWWKFCEKWFYGLVLCGANATERKNSDSLLFLLPCLWHRNPLQTINSGK